MNSDPKTERYPRWPVVAWAVGGGLLGLIAGKGDWEGAVVLGGIGIGIGAACSVLIRNCHAKLGMNPVRTSYAIVGGTLAGSVPGAMIGRQTGIGRTVLSELNRGLLIDAGWVSFTDCVSGGILGALLGMVCGLLIDRLLLRHVHQNRMDERGR